MSYHDLSAWVCWIIPESEYDQEPEQTGQAVDIPVHADPIAQFFIDHPGISLSKSARMLGIPRATLKRRYDVLVSTGMIQ